MAAQLKAATGRAVITPPVGIVHANWGAQTHRRAMGVDLDLWATALVLSDGSETVAIVDADLCYFTPELATSVRQGVAKLTGIPFSHVRLSATHTHSGPTLGPSWFAEGTELVEAYASSLPGLIAGAVWEAQNRLRPARVAAGSGSCEINVNRRLQVDGFYEGKVFLGRNWQGFVDHEVKVVRIDDDDENPLAVLVNYGCHPTIMGHLNNLITPDYPGVAKRVVEQTLGGQCLFLQGASGNVHAIRDFLGDTRVYHHLGTILGLEAARVALSLSTLPRRERLLHVLESGAELGIYADEPSGEPDGTLRVLSRPIPLPLLPVPDLAEAEEEYGRRQAELESSRQQGTEDEVRRAMMLAKRALAKVRLACSFAGQTETMVELHAVRVGNVGLVGIPGEPFAEIGAAVKRRSPFFHTLFSGLSQGGLGYIPMPEDYPAGGYGVHNTPYAPEAAGRVVEESVKALRDLAALGE